MIELQMVLLSVVIRLRMKLFFFQDVHVANSTIVRAERSLPRFKRLQAVLLKLNVKLLCHIVCGSHCVRLVVRQVGQPGQAGQIGAARTGHGIQFSLILLYNRQLLFRAVVTAAQVVLLDLN